MRGTKAKMLRRMIYGDDVSHRDRRYVGNPNTGVIRNTRHRMAYLAAKKSYKNGGQA
jgi:hypothetical protein